MTINIRGWVVNDQIFTCWAGSTLLSGAQPLTQNSTLHQCRMQLHWNQQWWGRARNNL